VRTSGFSTKVELEHSMRMVLYKSGRRMAPASEPLSSFYSSIDELRKEPLLLVVSDNDQDEGRIRTMDNAGAPRENQQMFKLRVERLAKSENRQMSMTIKVPPGFQVSDLKQRIAETWDDLKVEWQWLSLRGPGWKLLDPRPLSFYHLDKRARARPRDADPDVVVVECKIDEREARKRARKLAKVKKERKPRRKDGKYQPAKPRTYPIGWEDGRWRGEVVDEEMGVKLSFPQGTDLTTKCGASHEALTITVSETPPNATNLDIGRVLKKFSAPKTDAQSTGGTGSDTAEGATTLSGAAGASSAEAPSSPALGSSAPEETSMKMAGTPVLQLEPHGLSFDKAVKVRLPCACDLKDLWAVKVFKTVEVEVPVVTFSKHYEGSQVYEDLHDGRPGRNRWVSKGKTKFIQRFDPVPLKVVGAGKEKVNVRGRQQWQRYVEVEIRSFSCIAAFTPPDAAQHIQLQAMYQSHSKKLVVLANPAIGGAASRKLQWERRRRCPKKKRWNLVGTYPQDPENDTSTVTAKEGEKFMMKVAGNMVQLESCEWEEDSVNFFEKVSLDMVDDIDGTKMCIFQGDEDDDLLSGDPSCTIVLDEFTADVDADLSEDEDGSSSNEDSDGDD